MPIEMNGKKIKQNGSFSGYFCLGFTLIEIMLLILLLSIITVHIATTQQAKMQNAIIERAAQDILTLQAGVINYWVAHNSSSNPWPSSLTALNMPPQALCSPFLAGTSNNSTCKASTPYLGGNYTANYYIISIDIKDTVLAQKLITKLPNAWLDGTVVKVAIPAPTQTTSAMYRGWLVSAGYVSLTYQPGYNKDDTEQGVSIKIPNCPSGFEGHIILSPIDYQTGNESNYWGIHLTMLSSGNHLQENTANDDDFVATISNVYDIHGQVVRAIFPYDYPRTSSDISGGSATDLRHLAQYLSFCLPKVASYTEPNSSGGVYYSTWNTNFIINSTKSGGDLPNTSDAGLTDAQCSTSWQMNITPNSCLCTAQFKENDPDSAQSTYNDCPVGSATAY